MLKTFDFAIYLEITLGPWVYKVEFKFDPHFKMSLPSTLVTMGSDLECMASSYIILLPKLF